MNEPNELARTDRADAPTRRRFLTRLASGLFVATAGGVLMSRDAFADTLLATPWVEEGPFYPYNRLPLDRDNDLVIVGKNTTPAMGTIAHVAGVLRDSKGNPTKNAVIEIWQTDGHGVYLAGQGREGTMDVNFQGYGRFETDSTGAYRFRTIKPVVYPGRSAPHIHLKITAKGKQPFTTQLFIKGHPGNARDGVYGQLRTSEQRALVTKDFAPVKNSKIGEVMANFDVMLGATPQEGERGNFGPGGRRGPGGPGGRGGRPGPPPGENPWDY